MQFWLWGEEYLKLKLILRLKILCFEVIRQIIHEFAIIKLLKRISYIWVFKYKSFLGDFFTARPLTGK